MRLERRAASITSRVAGRAGLAPASVKGAHMFPVVKSGWALHKTLPNIS